MELVILVGLPASGKTSFYQSRFAVTHAHVSKDLMPGARDKGARQVVLIEEALRAGRSVVVDNTSPRVVDRAPLIAAARRHGARVVGYVLDTSRGECLKRNRLREGKARVPDVAVHVAAARMQPPTLEEGFDELFTVSATAGGFGLTPGGAPPSGRAGTRASRS
jgi:predicted kinase